MSAFDLFHELLMINNMRSIVGVVLVGSSCIALLFWFLRRVNGWYYSIRSCGLWKKQGRVNNTSLVIPPGDMGWPFVGDMLSFFRAFGSGQPDSFIYNLVSRYGRTGIYKTHLFWGPAVIVCSPEMCRRVLSDEENFIMGYPKATKLLTGRRSWHTISNSEHRRLRRLTTAPISGAEALSTYVGPTEESVAAALEEWSQIGGGGNNNKPIELFAELGKAFFRVIARVFMGSKNVDDSMIGELMRLYNDLHAGLLSLPINIPGLTFNKAMEARKRLVNILQSEVNRRREAHINRGKSLVFTNEKKDNLIDLLLEVEDEDGGYLHEEDIIDMLLLFLLAGHTTSVLGALWATIFLTENPRTFVKAKLEQEEIIKRRPSSQSGLTINEIKQMGYLSKVIDESLRIINVVFANFREAIADVNINGYLIPKGWKVYVWTRGVHMDPEIYPNPHEFNPERWDNIGRPKVGTFLPFGGGSRLCPGSDLAKLQISIFLHHFLLNYKLERVNPQSPLNHLKISSPIPVDNCLARIKKVA